MIDALASAVCSTIQVEAGHHGPSTVYLVDLPAGGARSLGTLDVRLNAIGYSAPQDRVYGLDDDGRVVALDRAGRRLDVPSRPSHLLGRATAGAVVGERLVVRVGAQLFSVDVDPNSGQYLQVVHDTWLWPSPEALGVDDFDLNPADGLLYGVAASSHGHAYVVTLDPLSGKVRKVPGAGRLPGGDAYGAVVFGRDGALYATNNREDGRSTLYRVALDGSGAVSEIVTRPAVRTIDAAGCLSVPPVVEPPEPTPPQPTPEPPIPPRPPGVPEVPVVPPLPGAPVLPVPTTPPPDEPTTTTTEPTTTPVPSRSRIRVAEPRAEEVTSINREVRDQRRWSLVAVILILGAGALARQHARRR